MKQLILKIVIPLTVISFATFTKWWYVLVVDGPDEILTGFPLPFVCRGWNTSGSLQIFITEFIVDLFVYFLICFFIAFCISRFVTKLGNNKTITIGLYSLAGLILFGTLLIACEPNNWFFFKRGFDMEVMETGYKFSWQNIEHPDFYKYHQKKK